MKYCKDCKWLKRDVLGLVSDMSKCSRSLYYPESTVTGRAERRRAQFCDLERLYRTGNRCGHEAKYFEPRPPTLMQRLLSRFKAKPRGPQ